MNLNTQ